MKMIHSQWELLVFIIKLVQIQVSSWKFRRFLWKTFSVLMDKIRISGKFDNFGLDQLTQYLAQYGNWPVAVEKWSQDTFDWQTMSTDSIRRLSVLSLMDVYVGLDRLNSNQSVILVRNTFSFQTLHLDIVELKSRKSMSKN